MKREFIVSVKKGCSSTEKFAFLGKSHVIIDCFPNAHCILLYDMDTRIYEWRQESGVFSEIPDVQEKYLPNLNLRTFSHVLPVGTAIQLSSRHIVKQHLPFLSPSLNFNHGESVYEPYYLLQRYLSDIDFRFISESRIIKFVEG